MSASRLLLLALLPGCIVYQVRRGDGCEKCGTTDDSAWVSLEHTGDGPVTTDPDPDPDPTADTATPTGPDPAAYAIAPPGACPGDTLVVRIEGPGAVGARFGAGVTVRDTEPVADGVVDLLVEVGPEDGVVAVTVETDDADVPLPDGFVVQDDCD